LIRAIFVALLPLAAIPVATADTLKVPIGYLEPSQKAEAISLVEQPAADELGDRDRDE
jgi:hypothetical protein